MDFSESKWIPIFRGGKQRDSHGRDHDGNALIDKAVSLFNPGHHEPPAVIGHPKDNAPAYGWVSGLKKEGDLLMAQFRQVQPAFAEMVRQGLFKKRSAAFYPDGSLRHVGFLGAMPPAVKGLPDCTFAEAEDVSFEFDETWKMFDIADIFRRLREWLLEKEGADTADRIVPNWMIEGIREPPPAIPQETAITQYSEKKEDSKMDFKEFFKDLKALVIRFDSGAGGDQSAGARFSEADIEEAKRTAAAEAEAKARKDMAAEFAEKERQARRQARKTEIKNWCDTQVNAGKLTPALVKFGVPEMLASFAEQDGEVEFGESKETATLFDRFKALFEVELPKLVEFGEVAKRGAAATGEDAREQKVAKFMEDNRVGYKEAVLAVSKSNPELFAREEV